MKKLLLTLISLSVLAFPALADENEIEISEPVEISSDRFDGSVGSDDSGSDDSDGTSIISSMKIGVTYNTGIPLASLRPFAGLGFGGGLNFEMGIPIPIVQHLPFWGVFFKNFAVSIRADYNYHLPESDYLNNIMNLQIAASVLTMIPFGESGLSAVPEIGIGMAVNFPGEKNEPKVLKTVYIDQLYSFALGFRFSHPAMLDNRLEFAVTPVYSISPEHDTAVQYFTAKAGILYRIK